MAVMIFSFIYNISLLLLGLGAAPWLLYQWFAYGKYRRSFWCRWGGCYSRIDKAGHGLIWVHAVSVGETKAVAGLVASLRGEVGDPLVVVSSVTETGHAEAKKSIPGADYYVYLPIDFSWNVRRVLDKIIPDIVIVTETDLWYHFLKYSKAAGARVIVVNGKVSERTMKRLLWVPALRRLLYGEVDLFCVQTDLYKERFACLGVDPTKLVVTGNIKFDGQYPALSDKELTAWKRQLGIASGDDVLVIGSTHDPEEKEMLPVLRRVWVHCPDLKVLLVPRHPERFKAVALLLKNNNIPSVCYSNIEAATGDEKVIVIDAMGLLRQCYQLADVAIVAGSYTARVGGHNILEPLVYGVPVIFGPHMHAQPELVTLVTEYEAGASVPINLLADKLIALFDNPEERRALGRRGKDLVANVQGATNRTLEAMGRFLYASEGRSPSG